MQNTSLIALSRQIALARQLDVVANNVANINTAGFKSDSTIFQEYLMPGARANQFRGGRDNLLSYVHDRATWQDFRQGPVQQTGNPLDIAVDGSGFIAIQTPQGERYTRNGAMQVNAAGELVTSEGYQVVGDTGPIVLQAQDNSISINSQGTLSVHSGSGTTSIIRGQIRVVDFAKPQRLQKDGGSAFSTPADMQLTPANARIVQGAVEQSNVRGVAEMSHLIEVNRSYTLIANIIQNQSDLHKSAIQQLADVSSS